MTDPCYPIISPPVARPASIVRRIFRRASSHPSADGSHHVGRGGHGHAAQHGPVNGAGAHHAPVYGPPAPPVAAECARMPGALPAGPGKGSAAAAGAAGSAGFGKAAGAGLGAAGGLGGVAKAALVAGGLGLAGAGAVAALGSGSPAGGNPEPNAALAPLAITLPGTGDVILPLPGTRHTDGPAHAPGMLPSAPKIGARAPDGTVIPSTPTAIPEPATLVLLAASVVMAAAAGRGRRRR